MNNYDDDEIVLSSDNSSDSDEYMNYTEVSKTNGVLKKNHYFYKNNHSKRAGDIVLATKYKKKSITWFNNKTHRERYKQILEIFKKQNQKIPNIPHALNSGEIKNINYDYNVQKESKIEKVEKEIGNDLAKTPEADAPTTIDSFNVKTVEPTFNNVNSSEIKIIGKKNMETEFHRQVNCLYTQHENIVSNYLKEDQPKSIFEDQITRISQDINVLNQMLKTKEKEWNRILYHRNLKTEVLERLNRVKQSLLLKKHISNKTLSELKESDTFISESKTLKLIAKTKSASNSAIEILERRANMKKEDLSKEKIDFSFIERLLEVPKNDVCRDQLSKKISFTKPQPDKYKFENEFDAENFKIMPKKNLKLFNQKYEGIEENYINIITKGGTQKKHRLLNTKIPNISTNEQKIVKVMNEKLPLCDNCKLSTSQIVCAGCKKQWYCNKKCQIIAWRKHHQQCSINSIH